MKYAAFIVSLICVSLMSAQNNAQASSFWGDECPPAPVSVKDVSFETAFAPEQNLSDLVIKEIKSAKKSIKLSANIFISKSIAASLIETSRAGVKVDILIDEAHNTNTYSDAMFLDTMQMTPHIIPGKAQRQNYILIDDKDIVEGAFAEGEPNSGIKPESRILVIHNAPELVKTYEQHWQKEWAASKPMKFDKK